MSKAHGTLALLVALACIGCEAPVAPDLDDGAPGPAFAVGPVVHHASVGGADVCEALGQPKGCDANLSLVANGYADGSASGQWQDTFGQAAGGGHVHVAVDCLVVSGNAAVVGGVVTDGSGQAEGSEGTRAITAVVDNGTSTGDAVDQVSFSFYGVPFHCSDLPASVFPLYDLPDGQVKVW